MSRIGRAPITVPAGVEVTLNGNHITVKGPKGSLERDFAPSISVAQENGVLTVTRATDSKQDRSLHGLTRTLIANMIIGVTEGFSKKLQINGVGYRCEKKGNEVFLKIGFSHEVSVKENEDIQLEVPDANTIIVKGIDKQKVGQFAAEVRGKRPPEPYKGKGIKYDYEVIRRKVGKSGKK
jgi:large subunit ribosomal protein L6